MHSHRSHGNTLWLDTIEERVELKGVDVITPLRSLRGQLLQLGLAETNTGHLAQLKQATSDVNNITSVIKPRSSLHNLYKLSICVFSNSGNTN